MKKNRMMRLASVLLVLCLLTTSAISGTFAKYTSTVTASDTASVAKWAWNITIDEKSLDQSSGTTNEFDLFNDSQIMDLDTDGNVSANKETDITGVVVAPGTGGKFAVTVTNNSEVTANYTISLTEETTLPIEYSMDNKNWSDNISTITKTDGGMTVYWRWKFDGNDTTDTDFGIANAATVKINVTVVATQVN